MLTDVHTPLTAERVAEINEAVRNIELTVAERREIAQAVGVTEGTVRRWFTQAGTRRNLLPDTMIGEIPQSSTGRHTTQMSRRLFAGILLAGGAGGDLYHKKDYYKGDTEPTLVDSIDWARKKMQEKFHRYGIKEIVISRMPNGWAIDHVYASPDAGENRSDPIEEEDDEDPNIDDVYNPDDDFEDWE